MEKDFMEFIRNNDPEQTGKTYYVAEVGEFPRTKMNNMPERLPMEDPALFSEDPLDFEESAAMLREDVLEIYHFTMMLNRFSDKFQKGIRLGLQGSQRDSDHTVVRNTIKPPFAYRANNSRRRRYWNTVRCGLQFSVGKGELSKWKK